KAVAERLGYNEKEFSNMLNGRKIIRGEDVLPIANALGVEPNEICKR
ncbi:MAG: helix-turn-helix domain-containing protein, partial [Anaerovoracaceae bacterium]